MLVISEKEGNRIYIGDNIVIQINEARDGTARLAIEAPKDVKIRRQKHVDADKRAAQSR